MIAPPEEHEILREACDGGSGHLTLEADPSGMICAIERPDEDVAASIIVTEPDTARRVARHFVGWADKQEGIEGTVAAKHAKAVHDLDQMLSLIAGAPLFRDIYDGLDRIVAALKGKA